MILADKDRIYNIDNSASKHKILPVQLMENAGKNAADIIDKNIPPKSNILIVCGKGHNGGDGYVIARHLFSLGHNISIFSTAKPEDTDDPTSLNYNICKELGIKFKSKITNNYTVIIDAMLGVGIKLPLKDDLRKIVRMLNRSNAIKVAVDLPTGINGDSGEADEDTFRADFTVTMETPKIGMYITPGKMFCGRIYTSKIGIPKFIYDDIKFDHFLIDKNFVKKLLPDRINYSNKGTFGKVIAIGGSVNYSGAIIFSSLAAVQSGAGLVYTAIPESIENTVSSIVTDAIKIPLKANDDGTIGYDNDELLNTINSYDAILIGPGIGTNPATGRFIKKLVKEISRPLIIDADALKILTPANKMRKNILITPHPGEAARLLRKNVNEINDRRLFYAGELIKQYGVNALLKGNGTIITNGKEYFINSSGDNSLARGGSGDILSGIILALAGSGMDLIEAASVGAYIHGIAGEFAGRISHGYSVSMSDILKSIPKAFECIFS